MINVNGKQFTMRNLSLGDVFVVSRILKKLDLKVDFQEMAAIFKNSGDNASFTNQALGMELFYKVLNNLGDAEQDFYEFLGGLYSVDKSVFKDLDFDEMEGLIEDIKNQKNLGKFLKSAGQLMKSKS